MSARFVPDFDPGSRTVAAMGARATGAGHGEADDDDDGTGMLTGNKTWSLPAQGVCAGCERKC
jgi:hypothetical protein